jgi:hypothetical protein
MIVSKKRKLVLEDCEIEEEEKKEGNITDIFITFLDIKRLFINYFLL